MRGQISFFDGSKQFKIDKPVRLIELFAGIGSQSKALERLNVDFEHYRVCEFDKYAVTSYNAIHGTNFVPSDITKLTASDLGITQTEKYLYIMTYSFPCQDLSKAGKQRGMGKDSGTRSGLLWEVERLLDECEELPQMLLMENVPDVIGTKNIQHFADWLKKLESLGYKNYYKVLNAKDFGIPQNRERCFMVSLHGDYYYDFPEPKPLTLRLKDLLEPIVDERYYLSDAQMQAISENLKNVVNGDICNTVRTSGHGSIDRHSWDMVLDTESKCIGNVNPSGNGINGNVYSSDAVCPTLTTNKGEGLKIAEPRCYCIGMLSGEKWDKLKDCTRRVYEPSGLSPTLTTMGGGHREPKIVEPLDLLRIRKLIPLECWRLMDFDDEDYYKARDALNNTYHKGRDRASSQQYKQAGNSIVVAVLQAIFKEMLL